MRKHDRAGKVLRTLLVTCAAITLIAACSSGKGTTTTGTGAKATTSTTAKGGTATTTRLSAEVAKSPCELLQRADLSTVTGITFDKAEPGSNYCIYTSTEGEAAITLHFTSLDGADPKAAIAETTSSCDAGTVKLLEFPGAQGGYRCTVKGVASVGATGNDVFAVLLGATLRTDVPTERILDDLATILEHAIAGS